MADTQRDGRDGRTNGGSADRPDSGRHSGCRPGCRGGWRARRDGGQEPQRPRQFWPRFWLLLLGLLDDLPFLPTGIGPARCGRLQARAAPAAIGERFGQAIVRHEALGHGRDQLAAGRVEEADGPPPLTVEATWGPDVGSVRIEFQLRPCIDAKRSNRAGNLWQTAVEGARPWRRPGVGPGLACWFGVEPPAGIEPATPS
jgi:hypothetical protein